MAGGRRAAGVLLARRGSPATISTDAHKRRLAPAIGSLPSGLLRRESRASNR
jgi:hypothetical protein